MTSTVQKLKVRLVKKKVTNGILMSDATSAAEVPMSENNPASPSPRRSSRQRTPRKKWSQDEEEANEEVYSGIFEMKKALAKTSSQAEKKKKKKQPRKRKSDGTGLITDGIYSDSDIDVYEDDTNDADYEVSKEKSHSVRKLGRRRAPPKKAIVKVKIAPPKGMERKPLPQLVEEDEDDENIEQIAIEDVRKYLSHINTPRSEENEKYKEVYDTIPQLRSSSPPRFTTKGVRKKRLRPDELGVRVVGKTTGNPFSNYGKKRNGIIYGNQPLKTVEDMEKYAGAAINVKKVLQKQAERLRLSSYVKPSLLEEARNRFVYKRQLKKGGKEEDFDVDIETVDDQIVSLKPETTSSPPQRADPGARGRKPGRTILECKDCGYKTTHSGHMKIHIICVHKDVKQLKCQYEGCGYECARKGSMTRHEKCVHRKDQVFKCELCSFESAWSISLERHIVTKHEKLKPWTCQVCRRSFGQQFTLTTHMNTVHKKVKRVRCAFCSFRSSTKVSVRAHILRMHKVQIEEAMNEAEGKDSEDKVADEVSEPSCNSDAVVMEYNPDTTEPGKEETEEKLSVE